MRKIGKKGVMGTGMVILLVIVALVVVVGGVIIAGMFIAPAPSGSGVVAPTTGGITIGACPSACPDTLTWSGNIKINNDLNDTGTEAINATMYFYETDGSLKTSITNTDNGAVTLQCGSSYNLEVISTSGAGGDTGEILTVPSSCTLNSDGSANCLMCGTGNKLTFTMSQHGLPEVRARDEILGEWMNDNQDGSGTDYETVDGVEFSNSSTANLCTVVDSGSELHVVTSYRANLNDEDANDLGTWVLVDAPVGTWGIPTMRIDGSVSTEASGSLNENEKIAYSDYEYVYLIPANVVIEKNNEIKVDLSIFALGGQNPAGADNVSVDYAPIGRYASTKNSDIVKIGAVDDSTSRTDVHTRFDTVFCIS